MTRDSGLSQGLRFSVSRHTLLGWIVELCGVGNIRCDNVHFLPAQSAEIIVERHRRPALGGQEQFGDHHNDEGRAPRMRSSQRVKGLAMPRA